MEYEKFKQLIDLQIAHHKKIMDLCKLGVDLIETLEEQSKTIELLWQEVLTEFGYNWLCWYLYEKNGITGKPRKSMKAWDDDHGDEEVCKDVRGLWEYLIKEEHFVNQLLVRK
jgi:hypothetical protein